MLICEVVISGKNGALRLLTHIGEQIIQLHYSPLDLLDRLVPILQIPNNTLCIRVTVAHGILSKDLDIAVPIDDSINLLNSRIRVSYANGI